MIPLHGESGIAENCGFFIKKPQEMCNEAFTQVHGAGGKRMNISPFSEVVGQHFNSEMQMQEFCLLKLLKKGNLLTWDVVSPSLWDFMSGAEDFSNTPWLWGKIVSDLGCPCQNQFDFGVGFQFSPCSWGSFCHGVQIHGRCWSCGFFTSHKPEELLIYFHSSIYLFLLLISVSQQFCISVSVTSHLSHSSTFFSSNQRNSLLQITLTLDKTSLYHLK